MPRHDRPQEKAKDFKGTILKLFLSLEQWRYMVIVACILALVAAALSTIAPNKLSDVTDVISDGIKPNTENIKKVSEAIYKNVIENYTIYKIRNNNPSSIYVSFFILCSSYS